MRRSRRIRSFSHLKISLQCTFHMRRGSIILFFFVAGAIFGDVGASPFVAAYSIFGEILGDSRTPTRCAFRDKKRLRSRESKLGERTGCGCPFHADRFRIMLESVFFECGFSWQAQYWGKFMVGSRSTKCSDIRSSRDSPGWKFQERKRL